MQPRLSNAPPPAVPKDSRADSGSNSGRKDAEVLELALICGSRCMVWHGSGCVRSLSLQKKEDGRAHDAEPGQEVGARI